MRVIIVHLNEVCGYCYLNKERGRERRKVGRREREWDVGEGEVEVGSKMRGRRRRMKGSQHFGIRNSSNLDWKVSSRA